MASHSLNTLHTVFEYIWDRELPNDDFTNTLTVLGRTYAPGQPPHQERTPDLRTLFHKLKQDQAAETEASWPREFLGDVHTRVWLTYRSGFPLIRRAEDGPSPLSFGSLIRGTVDLATVTKGFTTDAGWGCMIRTSQSLLANSLLQLRLGRDWRYDRTRECPKHAEIVSWFVDIPTAPFSIHNFVEQGANCAGKKPGEWFGPSAAARSIQVLCEANYDKIGLKVYFTASGDIYEDELFELAQEGAELRPVLILAGIRLGVKNVNPLYWDFLRKTLSWPQSVGIAGGRPSSSHYFFGFQGDYLFYLDPHVPQKALLIASEAPHESPDPNHYVEVESGLDLDSVHTNKIRKLHLDQMDPSMLVGLLVENRASYDALKRDISTHDQSSRFLNVYDSRPVLAAKSSGGLEESEFVDLGVLSMNEYDAIDDCDESGDTGVCNALLRKERAFSHPVLVAMDPEEPEEPEEIDASIHFDKDASILEKDPDRANETFEEIHVSETESRFEPDEPVVVSHDSAAVL
ncbi:hypothetical protein KL939_001691 [Ogataea angusta]|nr:hypothetical protein KL939_001691 [Ogataea angusta]